MKHLESNDKASKLSTGLIPNINIGEVYDARYIDAEIHYECLENLAEFFGRNMPFHHHDRFYQLHVILDGTVRVNLDETNYLVEGPMLFLTPPTIPHAFITEKSAKGHVITVKQQLVWKLMQTMLPTGWNSNNFITKQLCIALFPAKNEHAADLLQLFTLMAREGKNTGIEHQLAFSAILQLILINVMRLSDQCQPQQKTRKEDIRIFHHFNELIEKYYQEHYTLTKYASMINITEPRLNEICRRLSGRPSKRLVTDRLVQEACRLLSLSSASITEIGYQLGFKDPAYFARFFRKNMKVTAGQYRSSAIKNK